MSLKLDLHVHSEAFGRLCINEAQLREALRRRGLNGVAITNFSNVSHALWLQKKLPEFTIIVGQEIWSLSGHIVGLGLKERIQNFLSAEETIAQIHGQAGIAVAVHPFFPMGLGRRVYDLPLDAVEEYNGLVGGGFVFNFLAQRMARKVTCASTASSDTTDPKFIGQSYTEVLTDNPGEVLDAIRAKRTRLIKRALPLPFIFVAKNFLRFKDVDPCRLHAAPCFICGKSFTVRLFKKEMTCLDCSKREMSRIACCQGHYICTRCVMRRNWEKDDSFFLAGSTSCGAC